MKNSFESSGPHSSIGSALDYKIECVGLQHTMNKVVSEKYVFNKLGYKLRFFCVLSK